MKRDMDFVRSVLKTVADADGFVSIDSLVDDNHNRELVGYHVEIMVDAGLIEASFFNADDDPYYCCLINRLTWEGNDFLDSIRDETVWEKTKKAVGDAVGSASLDVFRSAAAAITSKMVLSQIGM